MRLIEKAKGRIVPNHRNIKHRWSFKIATGGALLGSLGTGLAAGTSAANLAPIVPMWAVFAVGTVIFACASIAMYIKQAPREDDTDDAGC